MASVKLPAWPKGVAGNVWSNALADASVYAFESDLLNYDTGTSVIAFAVPEDTIVLGVGVEIVSAFTGVGGGGEISVQDSASNVLALFGNSVMDGVGYASVNTLRRYAKSAGSAGVDSRAIEVDVTAAGASAGTFRLWLQLKPNRRNSVRRDYV
jgi:hypothetical protein